MFAGGKVEVLKRPPDFEKYLGADEVQLERATLTKDGGWVFEVRMGHDRVEITDSNADGTVDHVSNRMYRTMAQDFVTRFTGPYGLFSKTILPSLKATLDTRPSHTSNDEIEWNCYSGLSVPVWNVDSDETEYLETSPDTNPLDSLKARDTDGDGKPDVLKLKYTDKSSKFPDSAVEIRIELAMAKSLGLFLNRSKT